MGQLGVISAVHGIGGLGKTALAIQYAYAYADFYPGGRWLVGCAGLPGLAAAIRTLDVDLGVEFTDAEKLDDTRAAKRILQTLHERAERGAAERAGEPNPPGPRTLLILDNIDDARLLQPPHTDLLSGSSWLHVLATTRLGPEQLSPDDARHRLLPVDELPEDDALRLIASYQPQGRFASDDERAAAREIVTLLQGFTLAVEVVAVHLAERGGRLTCAALRDRLKAEGLTGLENVAGKTTRGIPHVERLVTVTLAPTLATLSPPESLVLTLAALLPPDHVPLPWLRAVAAATFPDLGQDAPPGYDDPWLSLVNHLISLRLLQVVELAADGRTPRLCRVHRLVQEVVKKTQPDDQATRERALLDHIRDRGWFLWDGWVQHEHRWELAPLTACADHWLERDGDDGPWLASSGGRPVAAARQLRGRRASQPPRRRADAPRQPQLRSVPEQPGGVAAGHQPPGRGRAAVPAGAGDRRGVVRPRPPRRRRRPQQPGGVAAGHQPPEPRPSRCIRRALAIDEASLGPDHPNVAVRLNNLAALLRATNRLAEAEPLYPAGGGDLRDVARPRPPRRRHRPQQPGGVAAGHQPPGRGRAAVPAGAGDRRGVVRPRPPRRRHATSTTWRSCCGPPTAWPRPSRCIRRALAIDETSYGPDHPNVATALNNLAELLRATNRLAEAEPLFRRALAIDEASYGPDHPDVAPDLNNLAGLLQATNRLAEAEPLYRRALAIDETSYGPDHPDVATALNNLAVLLQATNRLAEAEPLYPAGAGDRRGVVRPRPPRRRHRPQQPGGVAAGHQPPGRGRAAVSGGRWRSTRRRYGPDHPHVATALNNLAGLLRATNRLAEAEPLYRRALAIDEASYGPDHPTVATALNNLAELLRATNRLAEAEPLLPAGAGDRRGVATAPTTPTSPPPSTTWRRCCRPPTAWPRPSRCIRRALAIDEASYGPDHPDVATDLNNLAGLLQATNRLAEAEPLFRRALAIDEASYGPDHPDVATDLNNLAALLRATNRLAEAEPLFRRALAIDEASYGPDHPDVATALNNLAALLRDTNRLAEAEPLFRRALAIHEASYGPDHPDVATDLNNLAVLLQATNRLAEAEPLFRRAVEILLQFTRATGHEHPHLGDAFNNYAGLLAAMGRSETEIKARLEEMERRFGFSLGSGA